MRLRLRDLWTFGGLSAWELGRRTLVESWRDDVFGQGGRMAFYEFLAMFPLLLLFLVLRRSAPGAGGQMAHALSDLSLQIFPHDLLKLLHSTATEFSRHMPLGLQLLSVLAGAAWAAHNGTWALIYGLNRAYEVEESRPWQRLSITIIALTLGLTVILTAALAMMAVSNIVVHQLGDEAILFRVVEWAVLLATLAGTFGMLYRFAPDVTDHRWRWSTPGAACATVLWVIATFGIRAWFNHVNDYARSYGALNSVAMLLLWLYFCNGALLIGGEMNSEIAKAEHGTDQPLGRKPYRPKQG